MGKLTVLFVAAFVDMIGLAMIVPLLPYYGASMGLGATDIGLLVAIYSLTQLLSAPAWGRISDRHGRRPAIVVGLTVTAVAYLAFAFARTPTLLFAARAVQGLGAGTIGVVQAYVTDEGPLAKRTLRLGWLSAVTSFGAVVGPAFGSLLSAAGGIHAPGIAAAILSTVTAVVAAAFLDETEYAVTYEHQVVRKTTGGQAIRRIMFQLQEPASRLIWIYAIAIGAFYGTVPIMPLLLDARLGIDEHSIGYVIMYLGALGLVVRSVLLKRVIALVGEERMATLGIWLLAAGLAVLGLSHGWVTLWIALTLMPLGTAFLFPSITAELSRQVRRSERGMYMGYQQALGGVSRVIFPVGAGLLIDHYNLGLPFVLAGLCVLATLGLKRPVPAPASHRTEERLAA